MSGESARRPTQRDIAVGLGISLITVQRALRGTGYVSEEMRRRIRTYATRIGYRPHRAAQSLVRSESRRLAVFSTEAPSFHWDAVERGVESAAALISDFGYEVLYRRVPMGDTAAYLRRLRAARRNGLDAAAIVNNLEYEMERVFAALDGWEVPYVTLNIDAPTSHRRAFVGVNHAAEGRVAANFLVARDRRRGVLLAVSAQPHRATALEGADIAAERVSGFAEVAAQNGMRTAAITVAGHASGGLQRLGESLAAYGRRARGMYLTTSNVAIVRAAADALDCPIVVGTASEDMFALLERGTVSAIVYQNPVLQGYYAVRAMEHLVEHPDEPEPRVIVLSHALLVRENARLPDNHGLIVGTVPRRHGA